MKELTDDKPKSRAEIVRERRRGGFSKPGPAPLVKRREEPPESRKAKKKKRKEGEFDARWISGPLALLLAAAIGCYAFHPMFRIRSANLEGMQNLNEDEVMYYGQLTDQPIFMADPETAEKNIKSRFEMVRDVEIQVSLPASVDIRLDERLPKVLWDFGGSQFFIDQDGLVMENAQVQEDTIRIAADSYPGAVDIHDRDIPVKFSADTFGSMLTFGEKVPEGKTLYFTYENGYGWDTEQGWRIFFGYTDTDLDEKLLMAESITEYLVKEEIQPVLLSLEFKDAPFYRFSE